MTSKKGGSNAGKTITGAKVLMFFHGENPAEQGELEKRFHLTWFVNQAICAERVEVCMLKEEGVAFLVMDPMYKDYYGTKVGHPILQFTPPGVAESRGREKYRPGLTISRVFKLKKHRRWGDGDGDDKIRETSDCFSETEGIVFLVQLKGAFWGNIPPPHHQKSVLDAYYPNPRHFVLVNTVASACTISRHPPSR